MGRANHSLDLSFPRTSLLRALGHKCDCMAGWQKAFSILSENPIHAGHYKTNVLLDGALFFTTPSLTGR